MLQGWKTYLGAAILGSGAVLKALGYEELGTLLEGLGGALGVVGLRHKLGQLPPPPG